MMNPIKGLHHITAIAGDPQANVDFFQRVLGQRLVKTTINFDDPATYHLYYGDGVGSPGTIMTYFPWPSAPGGMVGNGETGAVAYAVDRNSLDYWQQRLTELGVTMGQPQERFSQTVLPFHDPDGMALELVGVEGYSGLSPWPESPVGAEHALRGFHGVTLWVDETDTTENILVDQMGYAQLGREGNRTRLMGSTEEPGAIVDLLHRPGRTSGRFGRGSVHHIAFRVADDEEELAYQSHLRAAGQEVTPVRDRQYFHSIYFRVPAGILFELATDPPGFLWDETAESLGSGLKLPPWLEANRATIEGILPPIDKSIGES